MLHAQELTARFVSASNRLSVATGRRSMVTIDFSITSARSLLKFGALRPVDARMVAQCELVTILGAFMTSRSIICHAC